MSKENLKFLLAPFGVAVGITVFIYLSTQVAADFGISQLNRLLAFLPEWILIGLGIALLFMFLPIFLGGIYYLKRRGAVGQSNVLVTNGIYQYTRNPIYIGISMTICGIGLILLNTGVVFGGIAWLLLTCIQCKREERELEIRFGDRYRCYKKQTPMLFPHARILFRAGTPGILTDGSTTKCIALLEKVRIGGSDQWILERSEDIDNPIVLYIHGGPGTSQLTSNRQNTRDLEKYFMVANWDQRGAGKSYDAIKDAGRMNIEQFIDDTRELTRYLLKKFRKERLVLVGHSWGSVIGALTASRYPELYHCYVGIGQVTNAERGEAVSYQWTLGQAKERNDRRTVRALEKIGPPPYQGNWQKKTIIERRCLGKMGGEFHSSGTGAFGFVIRNLIFSREYNLNDRLNFFRGVLGSMKILWPELLKVDLFESAQEFKIPVFFMEGRFDYESPSNLAADYFGSLKAPSKKLIWFENSAHMPNAEERSLFNSIMVEKVLPIAAGQEAG